MFTFDVLIILGFVLVMLVFEFLRTRMYVANLSRDICALTSAVQNLDARIENGITARLGLGHR